ncbi:MAG: hypothetical protein ACTSYJ_00595 [Candidatus Thorarchaeota archaeon]
MSLKLSTEKSLYKPITVEIDGVKLQAQPITRGVLRKMASLEKRIRTGDVEAAFEQVELIFGKQKVIDKLELRQINEIIEYVTTCIFKPERELTVEEKNSTGPGDKT